ncbi:MAG: Flp pilus assembly protein CpaB [Acidobacteria bacterium]|nr:Flp pilus assembly protein CpaB [Acidobacteriota bacterium]
MDRKRLLMIFGGAWVSAALLTWFLWANTKAPKTEKMTSVVAAARDLPAGTRLKKADVRLVSAVAKDLPKTAIADLNSVLERPLLFPVTANEPLTSAKVASVGGPEGLPAMIEPGKRAISVQVTDASGVGGLVQPRSHVDVLFTRTGSMAEAVTTTIIEDVVVMSIGRNIEVQSGATVDPRATRPQNQAATLLVTPEQARKLELAKNQGKISLALRNPLDHAVAEKNTPTTAEDLNVGPYLGQRGRRGRNLRDDRYWADLTGDEVKPKKVEKKEPPKPRFVVDVYRGDKHVQEIFQ